jgi:predicted acetyltransferase
MSESFNPEIIPATIADYPIVQNMARFYVYDRSFYMGWECEANGQFECIDFKHYFEHHDKKAYLIKVNNELAGFVLLGKEHLIEPVDWNMGEFFILAKFQKQGIGSYVAQQIFKLFPGKWSVAVMPENTRASNFWHKIIGDFTAGNYTEIFKTALELTTEDNPDPYDMNILSFDTRNRTLDNTVIRPATAEDIVSMVQLSYQKRRAYEQAQPQFWRYASDAEDSQTTWFRELLNKDDHIILVSEVEDKINGFVIGHLMKAPEVYDPGGLTLMIDDFCVVKPRLWGSAGKELLCKIRELANTRGASQVLVVSGHHDYPKQSFLKQQGLTIASAWYVGSII